MAFRWFRTIVSLLAVVGAAWMISEGAATINRLLSEQALTTASLIRPVVRIVAGLAILGACWFALWSDSRVKNTLQNIFSIPELVRKLAFTLGLLAVYRIGFQVPLPGVDPEKVSGFAGGDSPLGQAMTLASMFTGGALGRSRLFGLGIMPYITASIVFQLLTSVVPSLEKLRKEGPAGMKKIQEYTRYATVALCLVQAVVYMRWLMGQGLIYQSYSGMGLVFFSGVIGLTAGTIFLMWLGEQIDEYGIGNGISLLIMAGIVARLPGAIRELFQDVTPQLSTGSTGGIGPVKILFLAASFVFVVAGAILITQAQRRIPIQQAKHVRGRRVAGGQRHYMPLRINHGGVMPIIFASSLMIFPNVLFGWLFRSFPNEFTRMLDEAFQMNSYIYAVVYIGMIFFFAYFWTTVQFRPKEMADQLRDYGSFIPGLRPGKRTADYLERVMERITYCGAAFLALIAVIPMTVANALEIPFSISAFLGGTGLLIVVSVALDLVQRIESNLVMRNYGGFLGGSTRIKGAYG
jgi:preprotein translocase subunit SecY